MTCLKLRIRNPINILLLIIFLSSKRVLSSKHDVHYDAACPHVNSFSIDMTLGLLWSHVY